MDDAVKKSLELEEQWKDIKESFERGLKEKEEMLAEMGITEEKLENFDKKLGPEEKSYLEKLKTQMGESLDQGGTVENSPTKSSPRVKGIRV
jgi:predicted nuclease with TOPRIM domain